MIKTLLAVVPVFALLASVAVHRQWLILDRLHIPGLTLLFWALTERSLS